MSYFYILYPNFLLMLVIVIEVLVSRADVFCKMTKKIYDFGGNAKTMQV